MSEAVVQHFVAGPLCTAVRWRLDPLAVTAGWQQLRTRMARDHDPAFTRDEWAYLLQFLAPERLQAVWEGSFGLPAPSSSGARVLALPPREVALWLPNNVSLLGCLALVLVSLTGATLRVKAGSGSRDLCSAWAAYARRHLAPGPLRSWTQEQVAIASFGRADPANAAMSQAADVRVFFGSDEGAAAVERLPHAPGSRWFGFGTRSSEAWLTPTQAQDPAVARTLARVFGIYGQAGCTSPRRVVVVGGDRSHADGLADGLAHAFAAASWAEPPQAQASGTVLGEQWARAQGLEARRLHGNRAVLVLSAARTPRVFAHLGLQLQWASLEDAAGTVPADLQTVGVEGPCPSPWIAALAGTTADRIVPVARMHDFGPLWDGTAWWSGMFRRVES